MIWIVSELYYPEDTSTGHYMTLIAEGIGRTIEVKVVCGQPNYSQRHIRAPRNERHNGVEIHRCWSTRLNKDVLSFRVVNALTAAIFMFLAVLRRIAPADVVLVGTNPPTLPFAIAWACRLRGARCVLRIDDLYPEALIRAGVLRDAAWSTRLIDLASQHLYLSVTSIVVMGRDMAREVRRKAAGHMVNVQVVTNWADVDSISPLPRDQISWIARSGLQDKFLLGYAGNIGPLQGVEFLFRCALRLRLLRHVHFVFVGSGKLAPWLDRMVQEHGLENVSLLGQRPRSEQQEFLNSCDIGLVSLIAGMSGVGVPSRTYNLMAAGKPILAAVDDGSEIALMVREEEIGWVVGPGDVDAFIVAVEAAQSDRSRLAAMGLRARVAAETKYSCQNIIGQYSRILTSGES